MKKLFFCALAGAIGFAGAKTYEYSQKNNSNDLLLQNVEALTSGEDSNEKLKTVPCSRKPTNECVRWCIFDYPECATPSHC